MIAHEQIEEGTDSEYYWCMVKCTNCNLNKALAFFKRRKIYEYECPKCGNETLRLTEQPLKD